MFIYVYICIHICIYIYIYIYTVSQFDVAQLLKLRKSGFIKWSCWRRTAKRLIPVKSSRFEVHIAPLGEAVRLLDQRFMAQNSVFAIIVRDPPFLVFGQHSSEAADFELKIAAFSARVLCTILIVIERY